MKTYKINYHMTSTEGKYSGFWHIVFVQANNKTEAYKKAAEKVNPYEMIIEGYIDRNGKQHFC